MRPVRLRVNGEERELPDGSTVQELLRALGRDPDAHGVAVARNLTVVPRDRWADTALADGDRVDLVTAAGGG